MIEIGQSPEWLFAKSQEVRAFRINWDDETSSRSLVGHDSLLNPTRVPIDGVLLNNKQVERLKKAVLDDHPPHPVAACHYPHHGFVFTDPQRAIIGHIEICFMCSNKRTKPNGFADYWDFDVLEELVSDLGIEIANQEWGANK